MPTRNIRQKQNTNPLPILLIGAGVLFMVVAVILLVSNQSGTGKTNNVGSLPTPNATATAVASVERISPLDAQTVRQNGSAVIIDVRSAEEFAQKHAAGAINIPYNDIPSRIQELDPNIGVITYCT